MKGTPRTPLAGAHTSAAQAHGGGAHSLAALRARQLRHAHALVAGEVKHAQHADRLVGERLRGAPPNDSEERAFGSLLLLA